MPEAQKSGQPASNGKRIALLELYESLSAEQRGREGLVPPPPTATGATLSNPAIDVAQQIDEIERERKRLENQDFAQNTELKRRTLSLLFKFLGIETGLIFGFAFAQATGVPLGFHMEEWSFKLLIGATIAQITGMLFVAVRYLFPKNNT